jgi:hypothetical protein
VDLDTSGLPCADNSRIKAGRQHEEGPTGPLFIIWALRLKRLSIRMAILENTPAPWLSLVTVVVGLCLFSLACKLSLAACVCEVAEDISMQIIYFLLYDMYDVFPIPVDLADVGHAGASRARVYILVVLRGQFRQLCDPIVLYQQITTAIKATSATQPADYMTAGPLEIQLEASEVARIRSVPFRPNTLDLTYLLNEREVSAIHELDDTYRAKGLGEPTHSRNLCYFLGDNPRWSKTWSGVSGKIPTFRRNSASGKTWFPHHRRWMTHAERLLFCSYVVSSVEDNLLYRRLHNNAVI